ncbi:SMC-Scp complex subunit ScpB [bacterium J17]|nr:SMC-Scp complex subunit ScpB [bacterium J17]
MPREQLQRKPEEEFWSDDAAEELESSQEEASEEDAVRVLASVLPLSARVSSLLFVSSKPLSSEAIAKATKTDVETVEHVLEQLSELYQNETHGFSLREINGSWQFRTAPEAAETIKRLVTPKAKRLSRAAAETLAVVAYKQPVQKADIEAIRGVDALPTLKTLVDAKLIRIVGREDSVGQPALYGTTKQFLERFGLKDLAQLPSIREITELENDPGEVGEAGVSTVTSDGTDEASSESFTDDEA